jgi:hypothetical protein
MEVTMTSNTAVIDRWLDVVEGRSDRLIGTRHSNTVFADREAVYSYGTHFPLAESYRAKDGQPFFVLIGDRYSVTTSRHQSDVRGAMGSRLRILVPFSAMESAGIDRSTIEILDVSDDQWIEHKRSSATLDDVPQSQRTRYVPNPHDETCDEKKAQAGYCYHGGSDVPTEPEPDGLYHWTTGEHRLGAALFRARYSRQRAGRMCRGPFTIPTGPETIFPTEACRHGMTREHRIMVRSAGRGTFLSGWDQAEARPVYFLAQLGTDATTIPEALQRLKPDAVAEADVKGTPYVRQGDVFAVASTMTTAGLREAGATFTKRFGPAHATQLLGLNHEATERAMLNGRWFARGCLYHAPIGRRAEHRRRRMLDGKRWYEVLRNTVKLDGTDPAAWSARGYVD